MSDGDIARLMGEVRAFVDERDWGRFHTPKNLVMALTGEAGELTELFQWLTADESARIMADPGTAKKVRDEVADVFVYCLRLADVLGIDLATAVREKMRQNAAKYPVDLAKGNATKYDALRKKSDQ
jgi:NTP pyrophosphatase (non-canonical NTP hydrolase)